MARARTGLPIAETFSGTSPYGQFNGPDVQTELRVRPMANHRNLRGLIGFNRPRETRQTSAEAVFGLCRSLRLASLLRALLAVASVAIAVPTVPAQAASPLSEEQMDRVTAGRIVATAQATAVAHGRVARTSTSTEAIVRRMGVQRFHLRRIRDSLVIPISREDREVELGFASAEASAAGKSVAVDCQADLRFSLPTVSREAQRRAVLRPGRATCMCARFGYALLPN